MLVGTALANLDKAECFEKRNNITRLQDGNLSHALLSHNNVLGANKLCLHLWSAVFKQHLHNFTKILVEFVQRFGLGVGPRKTGNVPNIQTRILTFFNYCRKDLHRDLLLRREGFA